MRILIPIEMQDMKGGMLQSVELLLRFLPREIEKVVLIPRGAETGERMGAAGATVVRSSLGRWVFAKLQPARAAQTFWTVRREIRRLLTPSTVLMTNHICVEVLCGFGEPFRGTPRVFVNRGNEYGGLSGRALRHSLSSSSVCVATTGYQRETLVNQFQVPADRVVVIPNGVDLSGIQASTPDARPPWYRPGRIHIAVLGFPSEGKNQELLIRSVARLCASSLPAVGVIAGSPSCASDERYLAKLMALVSALSLSDDIVFVPFVENKAVLFSGIDILASTSTREGFGRTIIEGMAAGLPAVALRAGGPECLIADGVSGIIVPRADPAEFASALKSVIENEPLRRKLSENGRRACLSYDAREVSRRYFELFQAVASTVGHRVAARSSLS